jgi:hypothetical protein
MPRTLAFVCAAVLASAAGARAGDFCGSLDGPAALRALERYAAGRGGAVHPGCFEQVYGARLPDAVQARVLAACTRAVVLPAARRTFADLDAWCVLGVLTSGTARVGDRDLVGELVARRWSWDDWPPYVALAASGDARVRPFVLAQLATHREAWRKKGLRAAWARDAWLHHELHVLAALERIGTREDLAAIDEIAADQPRDRRVADAARRARAAAGGRQGGAP